MNDLNKWIGHGRLTKDCEIKNGWCKFSIACNNSTKKNDQWVDGVDYFDCAYFKDGGVTDYLKKGKGITIEGRLVQNRWESEGQNRSKVIIKVQVLHLDPRTDGNKSENNQEANVKKVFEDDLPF